MILADIADEDDLHEGHRLWSHIQGRAAELGLTGSEAITQASQPPSDIHLHPAPASSQLYLEAAD